MSEKYNVRGLRLNGQVTVYAALSLGLVLALIVNCVKSCKLVIADTEINMATRLSVESVFAGYNNALLEEFDIFAISDKQCCDSKLDYYASSNIELASVRNMLEYKGSSVDNRIHMTDRAGEGLEKQVSEYMKEGGYAEIVKDFFNVEEETRKAEKVKEITASIEELDMKISKLDETDLKLVKVVEGIHTNGNGFVSRNGKPVASGGGFAKVLISEENAGEEYYYGWYSGKLSREKVGISDDAVYEAMTSPSSYITVQSIIASIEDDIYCYIDCMAEEEYEDAQYCADAYESNVQGFSNLLSDVISDYNEALNLIREYEAREQEADNAIKECRQKVVDSAAVLKEVTDTLRNDIDDIKVQKDIARAKLCNKNRMRPFLNENINICTDASSALDSMGSLSVDSAGELLEQLAQVEEILEEIDVSEIIFDYSSVDFGNKGEGTKKVKKISQALDKGLAGIVLGGMEVMEGSFFHSGLATTLQKNSSGSGSYGINAAMFNAYIFDKFPSYTDVHGEDSDKYKDWCELAYVVEYILAGHDNDISNLNEVILKLSAVREATDFVHIVTDSPKRQQAFTLAVTLAGATGNMAAVKAAQYVIMGIWSYGESVLDVRRLLKGENLCVVKNRDDWKLSLENLIAMNFDSGQTGKEDDPGHLIKGKFSYEDYLGTLLLMISQTTKNYRVMQAMELRLISLGQTRFRMKNHGYEAECTVKAAIQGRKDVIVRKQTYSYAA